MKRSKKLPRGIRQRADGSYQAHKMIAGVRVWESFPAGTPESTMIAWREQVTKKPAAPDAPPGGSFVAAITRFETLRAAQPTIKQFVRTLHLWAAALGRDRGPDTITKEEIQITVQTWQREGLSDASGRKYLSALQTFFVEMHGATGPNPARLVAKPKRPKYGEPRSLNYDVIERVLAHIAPIRKESRRGSRHNLSWYRLRVCAYTGIPPGVLGKLTRTDVHLADAVVDLPTRLKGDGVEARSIPLTEQGVEAFRALDRVRGWGSFDVSTTNETWRGGARRAGVVNADGAVTTHQYDLRHSFGCMLYRETRDLATVGRFLGHAAGSPLTSRYALGAHRDVDRAAAAIVSARLAAAIAEQRRAGLTLTSHVGR